MQCPVQRALRVLAVTFTVLTVSPGTLAAQSALAGDWVLSVGESDFGNSPAPDSASLSIEAAGDAVLMHEIRYFGAEHGTRNTWFDQPTDGEVHVVRTDEGEFDSRASWEEQTLVIWRIVDSNIGELELTERISLEGEALVVNREIDVPGYGSAYQVMTYARLE